MAEEDVNYSAVVFRNKNSSSPADKREEETVYDEVKVANEATEISDGKTASTDRKGGSRRRRLICCLAILCVILLLSFIAVVVYAVKNHTSEQNRESLLAALENKTSSLTVENRELEGQNRELEGQNRELEGQNRELEGQINNLTRKIQDLEANWHELNVSRAQWSFDTYCIKNGYNEQCEPCQRGWEHFQSSCYAINNARRGEQRSWDGAREDCRGKISDLVVIASQEEKIEVVNYYSWKRNDITGYWIGLRVKDMRWQWLDGSNLTETSWIGSPTDGHCAISVKGEGLRSVNCSDRNTWICEKRALVL